MALLRISEKQLIQACKDYKQLCETGQIKRPDFWHFCGWIGETDTAISAIIKFGGKGKSSKDDGSADAGIAAEAAKSKGNSALTLEQEAAKHGKAALTLEQEAAKLTLEQEAAKRKVCPALTLEQEAAKRKAALTLTLEQEAAKYGEAAEELRRLATYIRGQYSTAPGWSGNCSGKALFNQKQNFDGCALVDKVEQASSGEISVKLVGDFGGVENPFG